MLGPVTFAECQFPEDRDRERLPAFRIDLVPVAENTNASPAQFCVRKPALNYREKGDGRKL